MMLALAVSAQAQAASKIFYVNDPLQRDKAAFILKGALQTVVGRMADIKGYVEVDPGNIKATSKAKFEVDLTKLKTGIGLRDKHMKSRYLETDKFPKAVFELTRVINATGNSLAIQMPIDLTLEGNLTIHGVSRVMQIPVKVVFFNQVESNKSKLPGDLLRIQGNWTISLPDFNMSRPKFMVIKLDDKVQVQIDLFAATGLQAVPVAETDKMK
jgi:polyisoprenoid-binding protein YceI